MCACLLPGVWFAYDARDVVADIMPDDNPDAAVSSDTDDIYGLAFWLAYAANLSLVCANSLTFRFAEFIAWLHGPGAKGTETLTGEIVRAGLIAAVIARFWLGGAIDRKGARQVWLGSGVLYVMSAVSFLACAQQPAMVWACRIGYAIGLAGMFSCSVVHIQNQVPPHRRTEVIGSLGSSGFLGTIVGTQLGDLIFHFLSPARGPEHWRFIALFGGVGLLGLIHLGIVLRLTRDDVHLPPQETEASWRLLFRHWPGPVLLVAIAMGSGFVVTTVFLTRFATALSLSGIGTFFLCYSITAFSCRWLFRKWGSTAGRHRMVLWGLAGMTVGHWLFIPMTYVQGSLAERLFVIPAIATGFGHALLFPAVVSLGAGRFPLGNRGTGTTLILGFIELGTALCAPVLGLLIDLGNAQRPVRGFVWMFLTASGVSLFTAAVYAVTSARQPDVDPTFPEITELDAIGEECADSGVHRLQR